MVDRIAFSSPFHDALLFSSHLFNVPVEVWRKCRIHVFGFIHIGNFSRSKVCLVNEYLQIDTLIKILFPLPFTLCLLFLRVRWQIFIGLGLPLTNILVYVHVKQSSEKFFATRSAAWKKSLMRLQVVYRPILELYKDDFLWVNTVTILNKGWMAIVVVWMYGHGKLQSFALLSSNAFLVIFYVFTKPYNG